VTPQEWQRVKDVFAAALEQPASRRAGVVRAALEGDPRLMAEVQSLLAAHDESVLIVETDAFDLAGRLNVTTTQFEGRQFGNYRIVREIGRGGMGAVFLAERSDGQFHQQVALKIIRFTLADAELERRFRRERQILASLNHPNIARLLDGGVSDAGEPFLVMEYIEGERLNQFADRMCLGLRDRLTLFVKVCSAVAYAHRNLVVHRDIKPSNMLITAGGEPKLLDFGLAKIVDHDLPESAALNTATALRALTPAYASPEQILGHTITTASDIYSLGVVLYELLTGQRPYHLEQKELKEIVRTIETTPPQRPSDTVLRSLPAGKPEPSSPSSPSGRPATLPVSASELRGDLDNIVLMALRKEPDRRYLSVEQFAGDVDRHLRGLPVLARPNTFSYRASKFIGRNRVAVLAASLIVLALMAGMSVALWQFRLAQRQTAKAEAVNDFLQNMLQSANPGLNVGDRQGSATTVTEVLDSAAARLKAEDLSTQPEVKAELQRIIGASYLSLGNYDLAEANLRQALAAQTTLFGADSPQTLQTLVALASLALAKADYSAAQHIYQQRLAILRTEHQRGRVSADMVFLALNDFAVLQRARGNSKEAEALLRESLTMKSQVSREAAGNVGVAETVLVLTLVDQGLFDQAEARARALVAQFREQARQETPELCAALTILGSVLMEKGALDEADARLREAEALYRKLFSSNFVAIYDNVRLQAQVLYLQGKLAEAETKINQTLENYRQNLSPQYISFGTALTIQGLILNKAGRAAEAETILRQAVDIRSQHLPKEHFMSALTKGALGEVLLTQGRFADAEPLLLESYESLKRSQATDNPRTAAAKNRLTELYALWHKPDTDIR